MAKPGEKFKTYKNVFDEFTERTLFQLLSQGHFERLKSPVSIGKESNVFSAMKGEGLVIVKIYRLEACDFNRMYDYIKADYRYRNLRTGKRNVIFAWVQREFRNLLKAREAGVSVPTPYTFRNNVLVEEFIGKGDAASKLKDQHPKSKKEFFNKVVSNMGRLHKAGLVHGDLSAFNILNDNENPVFIDFSQSMTSQEVNYEFYLERDAKNVATFFNKIGLKTTKEKIISLVKEAASPQ